MGRGRLIFNYGSRLWRQFFRTDDRFNAETFVRYLKDLQKHFGKVGAITDRASPHRAKLVRELLRKNKDIRIRYFPQGFPVS